MKKLFLASAAVFAMVMPAAAADLSARPVKAPPAVATVYDWSGFYIGANGGWGTMRDTWSTVPLDINLGSHDSTGAVAGGQIGYRWQMASWVFGVEAQGDWADLKGSHTDLLAAPLQTDQSRMKAFGLFTGQVGYTWSNALLYVKGGAAVTSTKYETLDAFGVVTSSTNDRTRWGGTVGAGFEFGFAPNWSAAVEYDHLFTGRQNVDFFTAGGVLVGTGRVGGDTDVVTARINYRWGGPVVAKY